MKVPFLITALCLAALISSAAPGAVAHLVIVGWVQVSSSEPCPEGLVCAEYLSEGGKSEYQPCCIDPKDLGSQDLWACATPTPIRPGIDGV
jgi:hypothetical protein